MEWMGHGQVISESALAREGTTPASGILLMVPGDELIFIGHRVVGCCDWHVYHDDSDAYLWCVSHGKNAR